MFRKENLQIFSWYSLPDLKYFFMKRTRNEAFSHFLVNFIERLPWKWWPLQNFRLVNFGYVFPSSTTVYVQSFITIKS